MVRCLFEQQNQSKRVGCCGQSMATPNIRAPWSKIHVTLSTIKSEFKRTFSEDVKSRHSDLKKKPKLIPEKYKKPKPHPSSSRSGESNLLEIREGWKPGLFLIMMHITGTEYPMQIEHCVELWFGADMLNHCTVATAGDVAHIKLAALF